jgi:hypothetical protein
MVTERQRRRAVQLRLDAEIGEELLRTVRWIAANPEGYRKLVDEMVKESERILGACAREEFFK